MPSANRVLVIVSFQYIFATINKNDYYSTMRSGSEFLVTAGIQES